MTDILEEVLHDQIYEKKIRYFKKALPFVILGTALTVTGMLGWGWYTDQCTQRNIRMGDIIVQSVNDPAFEGTIDPNLMQQSLENIYNSNSRISEIAKLQQVNLAIKKGDHKEAKILLEKIINNKDYYSLTTAYARLAWLALMVDEQEISQEDKDKFINYSGYFTDEDKEFFGTASIIKAIWHIRQQQFEASAEILKMIIASRNTPQIIKEQANALLLNN